MGKKLDQICLQFNISSKVVDEVIQSLEIEGFYCIENAIDTSTISIFRKELDNIRL